MLILVCFVMGCNQAKPGNAESKGDKFFYDESKCKVYTELSKYFDFKIEKWKYYYDEES